MRGGHAVGIGGPANAVKAKDSRPLRVVARSTDPVRLNYLAALLADAGISAFLLDEHMSVLEGSIGALPRRLVVAEEDGARAEAIIAALDEA